MGEALTRPIGPLPMWGWLVVALIGYYLYRKHASSSSASAASVLSGGTDTGGTGGNAGNAPTDLNGDENPSTNDSWATDAVDYLEGQGYTQSQAQSAIGTYTSGGTLDPTMATLVDGAIQGVGQPPQLILNTSSTPQLPTPTSGSGVTSGTSGGASTVSTSSTSPANTAKYQALGATLKSGGPKDSSGHQAHFQYTVKKGDTLAKLSSMFGSGTKQLDTWNNLKSGATPKVGSTIWV